MAQQFTCNYVLGGDEMDAVVVGVGSETTRPLCIECGEKIENSHITSFQCQTSESSLCSRCARIKKHVYSHSAHPFHFLSWVDFKEVIWTCNGCNRPSTMIKDTKCYFCSICKFYLCQTCFEPKKYFLHEHFLEKTDVRNVYLGGGWKCDCCGGNNGLGQL